MGQPLPTKNHQPRTSRRQVVSWMPRPPKAAHRFRRRGKPGPAEGQLLMLMPEHVWTEHGPDVCAWCGQEPTTFSPDGTGWCLAHTPDALLC